MAPQKGDVVVRIIVSAKIMRLTKPVPLAEVSHFHHRHAHTHFSASALILVKKTNYKFSLFTSHKLSSCHVPWFSHKFIFQVVFLESVHVHPWRLSHGFSCGLLQWSISAEWARETFALVKPHRPETTCSVLCKTSFSLCNTVYALINS